MKFTFKRNLPTGQYRSFFQIQTDIKLNKQIVGSIHEGKGFSDWFIRLYVKDETQSNGRKTIQLKKHFSTETEARNFLNENFEIIFAKGLAGY